MAHLALRVAASTPAIVRSTVCHLGSGLQIPAGLITTASSFDVPRYSPLRGSGARLSPAVFVGGTGGDRVPTERERVSAGA
jgi:hypothetical protein